MGTERHSLCTKAPKFLQRDITWSHSILNLFKTNNRENCEYCPTQVSWKSELSIMPVVSVVSVVFCSVSRFCRVCRVFPVCGFYLQE